MYTKEIRAEARRLYAECGNFSEVGRRLGIERQTVAYFVKADTKPRRPDCPDCGAEMIAEARPSRRFWYCTACDHRISRWSLLTAEQKQASSASSIAANRRRRERLRAFVDAAKDKPCATCGVRYPSWAMHFHHVRGTKSFNVSAAVRGKMKSEAVLATEIAKCDVLCGGCHAKEHHSR